jgi:hypothetical protein
MNNLLKYIILLIITGFCSVQAKEYLYNPEDGNRSEVSWESTFYISAGYGYPQGIRYEAGYNIKSFMAVGIIIGSSSAWLDEGGTLGIVGKLFITNINSVAPFFLAAAGSSIAVLGESSTYSLLHAGVKISLASWIHAIPEAGFDFTSKHLSGGKSLFGTSSPAYFEKKTFIGMNISLEITF